MGYEGGSRRSLPPEGTLFADRYRLRRRLAAGGMGVVYEAVEEPAAREVALKVLHPEYVEDAEIRRRFRRESSILVALDHPAIVRLFDFGTDDRGRCYTAMELLRGETLEQHIAREGRMTPADLVPLVTQMCDGLAAVHHHGVIHGDLKPANLFLVPEGAGGRHIKLVDFGLSKVHGLERLTRTGEVMGTPAYMAPELLTGEGEIDGRIDVYALGVTLYEALTGQKPFRERNPGKLMFDVVMGKAERLASVRPDLASAVHEVVSVAMAPKREGRYASPEGLARAFRAAAVG